MTMTTPSRVRDTLDPIAQLRRQRQRVEAILARDEAAERGSRASDEAAAAPASPERLAPDATDEERREFWARRFEAARKARRATR